MYFLYYWSKFLKKARSSTVKFSSVDKTSKVESGTQFVSSKMGRHSFCGYDCEIINTDIGRFCSIASGVVIGGGAHPIEWVSTSPAFYEGRDSIAAKFSTFKRKGHKLTSIGHDVWIGRNALVKQGVTVGTGSVIGMGSVVTCDVPPYSVVAGVPAKLIRMRFDQFIIDALIDSQWWMLSDKELKSLAVNIREPREFLKSIEKMRAK